MANVTAMVRSLRAEEGIEVSRLASVVAAMEKGLEALQRSSSATVAQGGKTLPQKRNKRHPTTRSTFFLVHTCFVVEFLCGILPLP